MIDIDLVTTTFCPLEDLRGNYIATYTGKFWPFDPRPEDVSIDDIAHGLSNICRYTGACKRRYSVAEHSVHIARWLLRQSYNERIALIGLLHDAPEALSGFGDVARPSKGAAPIIKETENNIWAKAVAPHFGLPQDIPNEVYEADQRIIADEMTQNLREVQPGIDDPLGVTLEFWTPERAEFEFLRFFHGVSEIKLGCSA